MNPSHGFSPDVEMLLSEVQRRGSLLAQSRDVDTITTLVGAGLVTATKHSPDFILVTLAKKGKKKR